MVLRPMQERVMEPQKRSKNSKNRRKKNRQKKENQWGSKIDIKDWEVLQNRKYATPKFNRSIKVVNEKRPAVSLHCSLCDKPIKYTTEAISIDGQSVHFDCAISRVNFGVELSPNQKVCYVGQGEFGLCEFSNPKHTGKFTILQRYSMESLELRKDLLLKIEDGGPDWGVDLDTIHILGSHEENEYEG